MPKIKFMGTEYHVLELCPEQDDRPELGYLVVAGMFNKSMILAEGPFEFIEDDGTVLEPGRVLRMIPRSLPSGAEGILVIWTDDENYELPSEEQFTGEWGN